MAAAVHYNGMPCTVIWDIENCTIPHGVTSVDVVTRIKDYVFTLPGGGRITSFDAYAKLGIIGPKMKDDLHHSGVRLHDVPAGKPQAADMAIFVELLKLVLDHPPPHLIVMITGDRDFAPVISVLVGRRYEIHLMHSVNAPDLLIRSANKAISWGSIINAHMHRLPQYSWPGAKRAHEVAAAQAQQANNVYQDEINGVSFNPPVPLRTWVAVVQSFYGRIRGPAHAAAPSLRMNDFEGIAFPKVYRTVEDYIYAAEKHGVVKISHDDQITIHPNSAFELARKEVNALQNDGYIVFQRMLEQRFHLEVGQLSELFEVVSSYPGIPPLCGQRIEGPNRVGPARALFYTGDFDTVVANHVDLYNPNYTHFDQEHWSAFLKILAEEVAPFALQSRFVMGKYIRDQAYPCLRQLTAAGAVELVQLAINHNLIYITARGLHLTETVKEQARVMQEQAKVVTWRSLVDTIRLLQRRDDHPDGATLDALYTALADKTLPNGTETIADLIDTAMNFGLVESDPDKNPRRVAVVPQVDEVLQANFGKAEPSIYPGLFSSKPKRRPAYDEDLVFSADGEDEDFLPPVDRNDYVYRSSDDEDMPMRHDDEEFSYAAFGEGGDAYSPPGRKPQVEEKKPPVMVDLIQFDEDEPNAGGSNATSSTESNSEEEKGSQSHDDDDSEERKEPKAVDVALEEEKKASEEPKKADEESAAVFLEEKSEEKEQSSQHDDVDDEADDEVSLARRSPYSPAATSEEGLLPVVLEKPPEKIDEAKPTANSLSGKPNSSPSVIIHHGSNGSRSNPQSKRAAALSQLVGMGFDQEQAKNALDKTRGNVDEAINSLLSE